MFQRESDVRAYTCPDCGSKLVKERNLLRCQNHGAFFAYGPQLLVRAPCENGTSPEEVMLPWEVSSATRTR